MAKREDFFPNLKDPHVARMMEQQRNLREILRQVETERHMQDQQWGGPRHDDEHSSHDWLALIIRHLGKATMWPFDVHLFKKQMIRVAALGVAAAQWADRFKDNYER